MGYFNYYAVKIKKLRALLPQLDIKLVEKDMDNLYLSIAGVPVVVSRDGFREIMKKLSV